MGRYTHMLASQQTIRALPIMFLALTTRYGSASPLVTLIPVSDVA